MFLARYPSYFVKLYNCGKRLDTSFVTDCEWQLWHRFNFIVSSTNTAAGLHSAPPCLLSVGLLSPLLSDILCFILISFGAAVLMRSSLQAVWCAVLRDSCHESRLLLSQFTSSLRHTSHVTLKLSYIYLSMYTPIIHFRRLVLKSPPLGSKVRLSEFLSVGLKMWRFTKPNEFVCKMQ